MAKVTCIMMQRDEHLLVGNWIRYYGYLFGYDRLIVLNSSLYNVPGRPGWFCPRFYEKGFVERNTLLELDHGFHYPRTTTSDRVLQTDLAYLHFHNKPLDVLRSNARTKLTGFVDPDDAEALRNFNGAGVHLKRYFALTEGDYRDTYKDMMQLLVPSIQALGHVLGLTGDMFGRSEGPTRNAVMVALDGGPDAPRPFGEIVTNPPASLSRPPPRLLRFVRSLHTHV